MKNIRQQKGDALLISMMLLVMVVFLGSAVFKNIKDAKSESGVESQAKNITVIQDGLQLYMRQNLNSIDKGFRIQGVADAKKPTFSELINLNYLPSDVLQSIRGVPIELEIRWASNYFGYVYTREPILDGAGNVDFDYVCKISLTASERGLCATQTHTSRANFGRGNQQAMRVLVTESGSPTIYVPKPGSLVVYVPI